MDDGTRDLLRLGLYQILLIETAAHAAVFETVELTRPRARSLVNAILRRALREKASLTKAAASAAARGSFFHAGISGREMDAPVRRRTRPRNFASWNNEPAPVYARINPAAGSRAADFLARYPGSALVPASRNFVALRDPAAALAAGDCYIQDPSTALACELLAAGAQTKPCSTPAPRPAASPRISRS